MFKGFGGWKLVEVQEYDDCTLFVLRRAEKTNDAVQEKWIYVDEDPFSGSVYFNDMD